MSTLFISDLHLDAERPGVGELLDAFLHQHLASASHLYILGDLFEAWIGDDDDAPWVEAQLTRFRIWTEQGKALFFLPGNRDFLIGPGFSQRTGIKLLPDESVIELQGQRTLLLHGDSLCSEDHAYQELKVRLRSAAWREDFLGRPLEERRAIAAGLRQQSRAAIEQKGAAEMRIPAETEAHKRRDHDCPRLIHGHIHQAGVHHSSAGERWVLGDWSEQQGSYLIADNDGLHLEHFRG